VLLGMIAAHIAALAQRELVGRLNSATEGSVSVQAEMAPPTGTRDWWVSTRYGVAAWHATAALRTAQYVPGRQRGSPFGAGIGIPWRT
jgi:hypothetical protein